MGPVGWLIVFIILGLVILVILALFGVFSSKTEEPPTPQDIENILRQSEPKSTFGKFQPVPNDPRGQCLVYTFNSVDPDTVLQPTFDAATMDSISPSALNDIDCLDADQLVAVKSQRTCGDGDLQVFPCIGLDGREYQKGEVEEAYVPCDSGINLCTDTLALISLNYEPSVPISDLNCITGPGLLSSGETGSTCPAFLSTCGVNNSNQLLRVQRADPKTLTPNSSGVYARIYDRESETCLIPQSSNPTAGTKLGFGECNPNQGYVWFLAPPINFTNPPGCNIGSSDCTTTVSPQQLVYTTTVDNPPSACEFPQYVTDNDPLVITASGSDLVLGDFVTDNTSSDANNATIQFVNYQILDVFQDTPTTPGLGINIPFYSWQ